MYRTFVVEAGFADILLSIEHLTAEATQRGLRTLVYVNGLEVMTRGAYDGQCNPTGITTMATAFPQWLQLDLDGEPIVYACQAADWLEPDWEDAWMSPFSGYRELFKTRIGQLAVAGVDGIYIDATFLPGYQADEDNLRWGSAFGSRTMIYRKAIVTMMTGGPLWAWSGRPCMSSPSAICRH